MVLEGAEEVELQRRSITAGVDCGESPVQTVKGELEEVLHPIVKERHAEVFALVERRRVVHARIRLARRREIPRYSTATPLSISFCTPPIADTSDIPGRF